MTPEYSWSFSGSRFNCRLNALNRRMATSRLSGNCTAPALHKSPTTYFFPSNVIDSLNFLLTSSSGLVSTSCTTPIESISQNLLNSKLSSSVVPAELLSVTVETMVVSCLPAELRAFGPQRIHPKIVSMAMGSSSPATLSPLPSTR
ncbi:hypothetical protein T07_12510 [Trichinella nelsoni]|uniref:Uncharacterized protein n=1 Tax=Trichinella nelsoni TaxID=6336 RepID=A0A0V0RDR7_9BILA|nr:hypothetical protein T07_1075 [Trichinella nelsoni]KRX12630.1 hypothetical protein T07_12510 [Trichinella nelsoni]